MTVKEVSDKIGLPISTILYYEKRKLINPKRSANNYRIYSENEIRNLKIIYLLREFNFSVNEIKQIIMWNTVNTDYMQNCETAQEFFLKKKEEIIQQINFMQQIIKIIDNLPLFSKEKIEVEQKSKEVTKLINKLFGEYLKNGIKREI